MLENGLIVYDPFPGAYGYDTLEYKLCDIIIINPATCDSDTGLCDIAKLIIKIEVINTTFAVNDQASTWVNFEVSGNILTNDFDIEEDTQIFGSFLNQADDTILLVSGATVSGTDLNGNFVADAGQLIFDEFGDFTFIPSFNFTGEVSVTYSVCDDQKEFACDQAILTITVNPLPSVTNSIIANNDEYVSNGNQVDGNVLSNDADPQSDNFSVTEFLFDTNGDGVADSLGTIGSSTKIGGVATDGTPVSNAGNLILNSDGTFTFVPENNFTGIVEVIYTVCDDSSPQACANATLTIFIITDDNGALNDPPFGGDDFIYTTVNNAATGDFISNDSDLNNDPISINGFTVDVNGPNTLIQSLATNQGGTVELYQDGTYQYFPPDGYVGPDFAIYELCDVTIVMPNPLCANATITILVGMPNTVYAVNDEQSTWVDYPTSGNVVANDFDLENHNITFGSFLDPVTLNPITSNTSVSGIDLDGNPVSNAGTLVFDITGNYTFTPATGFTGVVSIPYTICDNGLPEVCETAYLTIAVSPLPSDDNAVIANNSEYFTFSKVEGNITDNDADPQGDQFSVTDYQFDSNGDGTPDATGSLATPQLVGGVSYDGTAVASAGTITLNSDGSFEFEAEEGFIGTVTMVYTICDDNDTPVCTEAEFTISVLADISGPYNDPPFAGDDFLYTSINLANDGNFISNDSDLNGDSLSVNGVVIDITGSDSLIQTLTTAQGGSVEFYANGTYTYFPPRDFVGSDHVIYEVCDVTSIKPEPLCANATIHLLIAPGITLSGSVWQDSNGTIEREMGELNTDAEGDLYVNVVDQRGLVVATAKVLADGTYEIDSVPILADLFIQISTTEGVIGMLAPLPSVSDGWVSTGQNFDGLVIDGSPGSIPLSTKLTSISDLDFGIQILPIAASQSIFRGYDPLVEVEIPVSSNLFITSDADGTVDSIRFTAFPSDAVLFTIDGVDYTLAIWPPEGVTVLANSNGQPAVAIEVVPVNEFATVVIPFAPVDNANKEGLASSVSILLNNLLPVELLSFEDTNSDCKAVLKWTTATEINNDYFVIYASSDALTWHEVATVKGNGSTAFVSSYKFIDESIRSGKVYYRLYQVDFNGDYEWLPIRSADFNECGNLNVSIYPNPVSRMLNVEFSEILEGSTEIQIFNTLGKLVYSKLVKQSEGIITLDLFNLLDGNYKVIGSKKKLTQTFPNEIFEEDDRFSIKIEDFNSKHSDFAAYEIVNDVFFISNRKDDVFYRRDDVWSGRPFTQLFRMKILPSEEGDTDVKYDKPVIYGPKEVSSKFHEGPISYDRVLNDIYLTRTNYNEKNISKGPNNEVNLKIFKISYVPETGDFGTKMVDVFSFSDKSYTIAYPAVTANGKFMFFASDMPGGYGGLDLYVAQNIGGIWSNPVNLGEKINTPGNETFPFVLPNGTLFFSSDGHLGLGGLDIYMSPLAEDGTYDYPQNMKYPINSTFDDFSFFSDDKFSRGFFSSNRPSEFGDDDIYSFKKKGFVFEAYVFDSKTDEKLDSVKVILTDLDTKKELILYTDINGYVTTNISPNTRYSLVVSKNEYLPEEAEFTSTTDDVYAEIPLVRDFGIVLDVTVQDIETKDELGDAEVILINMTDEREFEARTNKYGKVSFVLDPSKEYRIKADKDLAYPNEDYLAVTKDFNTFNVKAPANLYTVIELKKERLGIDIKIENIYYDLDKYAIRKDAAIELDKLVKILLDNPTMEIELSSHTDCRGSAKYNMWLSAKRAESAVNYLIEKGVSYRRLTAAGYGESKLVNDCECEDSTGKGLKCSEDLHQKNRRTVFTILKF